MMTDLTRENIRKLMELFPNCVTEAKDDPQIPQMNTDSKTETEICKHQRNLRIKIDFDLLRQELSDVLVEGPQERYHLNWPGKREALLTANAPIAGTLRPCRDESVNFDTTKNLLIEGDNLEALKLLQETYLGKVKMIYIDPPYNTGSDLIYKDNFAGTSEAFLKKSNQKDRDGNRLVANTDTNGRFHSDWLSMIYPRLKLARNLLRDDGVLFISIDDNESANLKKICDELFGESSFAADICVVTNLKGRNDKKFIAAANERLLMYVKTDKFCEYGLDLPASAFGAYREQDARGKYRLIELRKRGGPDTRSERPNLYYAFYINAQTGSVSLERDSGHTREVFPVKSNGVHGRWRWARNTAASRIERVTARRVRNTDRFNIYEKDYLENKGEIRRIKPKSVWAGADYSTDTATKQYRSLMGELDFSNPKSLAFLTDLVTYATDPFGHCIILDFFAGSGTTAHAVLQRNARDGGNRRFIMIQLPEACPVKSSAYAAGARYLSDITRERIRRAGKLILEKDTGNAQPDIGFRVLKVDSSSTADVCYRPDDLRQELLLFLANPIKPDRSPEDLLFQVMLDWGVDLTLPISRKIVRVKDETQPADTSSFQEFEVYCVDENSLVACFDSGVTEALVTELARCEPLRVMFRDDGFVSDAVKINVAQIFREMSPGTDVKSI